MGLQSLFKIFIIFNLQMELIHGGSKSSSGNSLLDEEGKHDGKKAGNTNVQGSASFQFGGNIFTNRYCGAICSWSGKTGGFYLSNKLDFFALFNFNGNCLCTCPVPYPTNTGLCSRSSCNSVCQYNKFFGGSCDLDFCNCLSSSDSTCGNSASDWILPPTPSQTLPVPDNDDGCPGDCPDTSGTPCVTKPSNPNAKIGCFPYGIDWDTLTVEDDDGFNDYQFPFTYLGVDYPAVQVGNDGWLSFYDDTLRKRNQKILRNGTKKAGSENRSGELKKEGRMLERATTCSGYFPGENWNIWNVNMNNEIGGQIWYRVSARLNDRARALKIVQKGFPGEYDDAVVSKVLVVTWDNIAYNEQSQWGPHCPGNTIQAVIIKGPPLNMLFACFKDITWLANDSEDYCHGQGYGSPPSDFPLVSFYNSETGVPVLEYPGACSRGVKNLIFDTNMKMPGRFLFDVSTATLTQPSN